MYIYIDVFIYRYINIHRCARPSIHLPNMYMCIERFASIYMNIWLYESMKSYIHI